MLRDSKISPTNQVSYDLKSAAQYMKHFIYHFTSLTKEIVKQVSSVLYNFIWDSGKDKTNRLSLISDYENGELRMPHIEAFFKTQRIMCMHEEISGQL